jgi:uncharacterized protein
VKKLLVALMFVLLGTQVTAQDYYKGLGAYESQDFEVALKELKPLAEQGNVKAQELVGLMYYLGKGNIPQDSVEAYKWFLLAAKQGNNFAQLNLGIMHFWGQDGISKDFTLAHMWQNLASFNGHPQGEFFKDATAKRLPLTKLNKALEMARECMTTNYKKCGY